MCPLEVSIHWTVTMSIQNYANGMTRYYRFISYHVIIRLSINREQLKYTLTHINRSSTGVSFKTIIVFLIYINYLLIVSNVFKLYADDTTLYCNINQNDTIKNKLAKIWEWLNANKLSLNTTKTKYMVFHTNQRNVI